MGVFQISPFDKGGMLYRPSKEFATTVGTLLSPMAFAALYGWRKIGFHTTSVGLARTSDLDEVMEAVRLYTSRDEGIELLEGAEERLNMRRDKILGKEWVEKGLLNLPSCFEKPSHGIAIGHVLWCHDLITVFGMYGFARARYLELENAPWNKKLSFEENAAKL